MSQICLANSFRYPCLNDSVIGIVTAKRKPALAPLHLYPQLLAIRAQVDPALLISAQ